MWFNPTFLDYIERKAEMARRLFVDEKIKYCQRLSFSADHLGPNEKQVIPELGGRMSRGKI